MTDRFSSEYIAFILSDEAKVLQQRFFEEGDWAFLFRKPRLVKRVDREARVLIGSAWYGMENLTWLPTLTDLLGMIEEHVEGWSMSHSKDYPKGFAYQYSTEYGVIEINGSDNLLLAAAKLAVRVLEGKE